MDEKIKQMGKDVLEKSSKFTEEKLSKLNQELRFDFKKDLDKTKEDYLLKISTLDGTLCFFS